MTREEELDGALKAAFEREVQTMRIDAAAGAHRLQKELDASARARSRGRAVIAAAVLLVGTTAGWAAWNSEREVARSGHVPVTTSSPRITPIPSSWPYLLHLRTGEQTPLPARLVPGGPNIGTVYALLPGTRRIALTSCPLTPRGCLRPSAALIASLDDDDVRTLHIPAASFTTGIDWSPDGESLLYGATNGNPYAVGEYYVYDLRTDRSTQITNLPLEAAWWWSLQASFTADGRSVLYDLPRDGAQVTGWDVWSVPVTGGSASVFLNDAKAPKPVPGGSSIAFVLPKSGVWGGSALGIVDDSGSRRVLVETEGEIGWLHVSPDGTRIAYNDVRDGETVTWVVEIATGQKTRVASGGPGPWLDDHTLIVRP